MLAKDDRAHVTAMSSSSYSKPQSNGHKANANGKPTVNGNVEMGDADAMLASPAQVLASPSKSKEKKKKRHSVVTDTQRDERDRVEVVIESAPGAAGKRKKRKAKDDEVDREEDPLILA